MVRSPNIDSLKPGHPPGGGRDGKLRTEAPDKRRRVGSVLSLPNSYRGVAPPYWITSPVREHFWCIRRIWIAADVDR